MLGYRTLFSVDGNPDIVLDDAVRLFRRWLGTKPNQHYDGDVLEFGRVTRFGADAAALLLQESQPNGSHAVRATLTEVNTAGRWTTRLTAAATRGAPAWVWVDVDAPQVQKDGSERRQWTSTPNLVKALLDTFTAHDGSAQAALGVRPWRAFPDDVDSIIDMICDTTRRDLMFLAGTAPDVALQPWIDQVAEVLGDTAGLAATYVLDPEATVELNARMFGTHGVDPGTIRTYRPGADPASEWDARRHRILGEDRLASDSTKFLRRMLGWRARESAIEQPLPKDAVRLDGRFETLTNDVLVARVSARIPTPPFSSPDDHADLPEGDAGPHPSTLAAVDDRAVLPAPATSRDPDLVGRLAKLLARALGHVVGIDDVETEVERLAADTEAIKQWDNARDEVTARMDDLAQRAEQAELEVNLLRGQIEDEQLDHAQTSEDLIRAEGIRDQLRVELATLGKGEIAWSIDGQDAVIALPDSFDELVARLPELELVSFTGDSELTLELERHDSGDWARKAWQALQALNGYAAAKSGGEFDGSLEVYLRNTPAGRPSFSAQRHTGVESEAVNANPKFWQARVFPVPPGVEGSCQIYMPAHFKVGQRGTISPRLHYFDATALDGRIYVGYLGQHLPTKSTN